MSSLASQLSTLTGQKSSTKKHSDVIGRGFGFTSASGGGGALTTTESSASYKPTLIYSDAKEASDIPLSLLRSKCYDALKKLGTIYSDQVLYSFCELLASPNSIHSERALMTTIQNEQVDLKVRKLLLHLTPVLVIPTTLKLCMDVLEYLIRRYDVHRRNGIDLVMCMVCLHETFKFSRVLQLVNIAEIEVLFFLRAYAAPGAGPPERSVVSKRCAVDNELLKRVCDLAKNTAVVHVECSLSSASSPSSSSSSPSSSSSSSKLESTLQQTPPHASLVISFATATVVESIHLQTTSPTNPTNSLSEATARALLPYIISAVGASPESTNCQDYRAFGYVVAACLAQSCTMGSAMREVVATAIVAGALATDNLLTERDKDMDVDDASGGGSVANSLESLDCASDAIMAVMATLMQGRQLNDQPTSNSNSTSTSTVIPLKTYKTLTTHRLLPASLGHIHSTRGVPHVVVPFISSLLSRVILHLCTRAGPRYARLGVQLTREPGLRSVWGHGSGSGSSSGGGGRLAETCAEELIEAYNAMATSQTQLTTAAVSQEEFENYTDNVYVVLKAVHDVEGGLCDRGIARAVERINTGASSTGSGKGKGRSGGGGGKEGVDGKTSEVIDRVCGVSSSSSSSSSLTISSSTSKSSTSSSLTTNASSSSSRIPPGLPPRVSLEHPSSSVRIAAVELVASICLSCLSTNDNGGDDDMEIDNENDSGSEGTNKFDASLARALLHRFIADDDINVAVLAGKAFLEISTKSNLNASVSMDMDLASLSECMQCLNKWGVAEVCEMTYYNVNANLSSSGKKDKDKDSKDKDSKKDKKNTKKKSHATQVAEAAVLALRIVGASLLNNNNNTLNKSETESESESYQKTRQITEILISHLPCIFGFGVTLTNAYPLAVTSVLDAFDGDDVDCVSSAALHALGGVDGGEVKILKVLSDFYTQESDVVSGRAAYAVTAAMYLHMSSSPSSIENVNTIPLILKLITPKKTPNALRLTCLLDVFKKSISSNMHIDLGLLKQLLSLKNGTTYESFGIPAIRSMFLSTVDEASGIAEGVRSLINIASSLDALDGSMVEACVRGVKLAGGFVNERSTSTSSSTSTSNGTPGRKIKSKAQKKTNTTAEEGGGAYKLEVIIPTLSLLTHPERTVRKATLFLLEAFCTQPSSCWSTSSSPSSSSSDSSSDSSGSGCGGSVELMMSLINQACQGYAIEFEIDPSALPRFLSSVVNSSSNSNSNTTNTTQSVGLRETLLNLITTNCMHGLNKNNETSFNSTATLLKALELASSSPSSSSSSSSSSDSDEDSTFPLTSRWEITGNPIFTTLCTMPHIPSQGMNLMKNVVRMMRGVQGDGTSASASSALQPPGIVTGVNGRARSYSVTLLETSAVGYVWPLPKSMIQGYIHVLTTTNNNDNNNNTIDNTINATIKEEVIRTITASKPWSNNVFSKLSTSERVDIFKGLVDVQVFEDGGEIGRKALENLKVTCVEVLRVLGDVGVTSSSSSASSSTTPSSSNKTKTKTKNEDKDQIKNKSTSTSTRISSNDEDTLQTLTILSEYITQSAQSLLADSVTGTFKVCDELFGMLGRLSGVGDHLTSNDTDGGGDGVDGDVDGDGSVEYVKNVLIATLLTVMSLLPKENKEANTVSEGGTPSKRQRKRSNSNLSITSSSAPTQKELTKNYAAHAQLLVSLIGGNTNTTTTNTTAITSTSATTCTGALSLLTVLCNLSPESVTGALLPALRIITIQNNGSGSGSGSGTLQGGGGEADDTSDGVDDAKSFRLTNLALHAIIPSYILNANSTTPSLSLINLMHTFISGDTFFNVKPCRRSGLFGGLISALVGVERNKSVGGVVGCVLCCFLRGRHGSDTNTNSRDGASGDGGSGGEDGGVAGRNFCLSLIQRAATSEQVHAMLQLLTYASELLAHLSGPAETDSDLTPPSASPPDFWKISLPDLIALSCTDLLSSDIHGKRRRIMTLTTEMLMLIQSLASHPSMPVIVKNTKGAQGVLLVLWERLLGLQGRAGRKRDSILELGGSNSSESETSEAEQAFWTSAPDAAQECMSLLQKLLTVPNFLASTKTLIESGSTVDAKLRKRNLVLLGSRASVAIPGSGEYRLFLETVNELVEIVDDEDNDDYAKQAGLVAIERLAKNLTAVDKGEGAAFFTSPLKSAVNVLKTCCDDYVNECSASDQLFQSGAMCASAVIGVLKARALPCLGILVTSVVAALDHKDERKEDHAGGVHDSVQIATLKVLLAVAMELPQFLGTHLFNIVSAVVKVNATSTSEDDDDDDNALNAVEGSAISLCLSVKSALSKNVPARLLLPVLTKVIAEQLNNHAWFELKATLGMYCSAINNAPRRDLSSIINVCIEGMLCAYEASVTRDVSVRDSVMLLSATNSLLIAIVMKGSESQFKPLYTKIREWSDEGEEGSSSSRKYAFWSASARLAKELRGIFLPCLSTAMTDAVDLLEAGVKALVVSGGGKKRKIAAGGVPENNGDDEKAMEALSPLQPLLLCLETSLKSDAHDGGAWAKAQDGSRYYLLLKPMVKLLSAKIPAPLKVACNATGKGSSKKTTAFDRLIGGDGTKDYGNVVACCVALAHAGGSEQLWKPLNHAILDACGNESRPEVRIVGLKVLLGILGTLGEEYLALLPECLPVLSELLEDNEPVIVGLTKECVKMAEDLSGESLDEFLQ